MIMQNDTFFSIWRMKGRKMMFTERKGRRKPDCFAKIPLSRFEVSDLHTIHDLAAQLAAFDLLFS